ncbi:MAG: type II toxin-antitoxin system ParD family antitoxin, partial [Crocinitomicaceae bacterium]|nr:type II toxin-antitoxin system ParD family antitoxin [Crocinitomicaceae bacterium]
SYILGEQFDQMIREEVESGKYKNASEVVREGLRLLFEKKKAEEHLIFLVEESQKEGYDENFDREKYLEDLKKKYSQNPKK